MSDKLPHHAVGALVEQLRSLLAGHPPEVQGGVLADLVATFFAGHHPALREEMITMWIGTMRQLVPVNEDMLREQGRIPPEWRMQ